MDTCVFRRSKAPVKQLDMKGRRWRQNNDDAGYVRCNQFFALDV